MVTLYTYLLMNRLFRVAEIYEEDKNLCIFHSQKLQSPPTGGDRDIISSTITCLCIERNERGERDERGLRE